MTTTSRRRAGSRLTEAEVADIRSYLAAHKWIGAKKAIAIRYGISVETVSKLFHGRTHRGRP